MIDTEGRSFVGVDVRRRLSDKVESYQTRTIWIVKIGLEAASKGSSLL